MPKNTSITISFLLSGAAGLGYEIIWTRQFAIGLGHEYASVLAVVAAFFGGIALGAWAFDGVVSRAARPGRWYAVFEACIGGWALLTLWLIPATRDLGLSLIGPAPSPAIHWLWAFAVPLITLLPATAALGATLPAIDRLTCRLRQRGFQVGRLYAINTIGAVAGTVLATFWLIPTLGFRQATLVLVAVNLCCVFLILSGPARGERSRPEPPTTPLSATQRRHAAGTLLLTGLLGIGYEVLGVRVMSQALENTVFTFATILSVYLLGTASGAAVYQRWAETRRFEQRLATLLVGTGAACLVGVMILRHSAAIYQTVRAALGGSFGAAITGELALAAAVFLVPTMLMGATFSHLAGGMCQPHRGVGQALALNTLGSASASGVFGVCLLQLIGSKMAMTLLAAGYLVPLAYLPRIRRQLLWAVPLFALLSVYPTNLLLTEVVAPRTLVQIREGVLGTVSVIEEQPGVRTLMVNNRFQMGGTGPGAFSEKRQAHIPLLLHGQPRSALFLGLGSGVTFAAASDYPDLHATGVELIPEIVGLLPEFAPASTPAYESPRLTTIVADARRYVRSTSETFDVIVADLFHPARDGAGALYTAEHFRAVRRRLADGGLFCQWLPLYQMDQAVFQTVIRTFLEVFPHVRAYLAYFNANTPMIGLIGRLQPAVYPPNWYEQQAHPVRLRRATDTMDLGSSLELFGCFVASRDQLQQFAGDGDLNTDDLPVVTFRAPLLTYTEQPVGLENTTAIVKAFPPVADELFSSADRPRSIILVNRYLEARNHYLSAMIALARADRETAGDLLVRSVRTSLYFDTAYEVALSVSRQLAVENRSAATDLLQQLEDANPRRGGARRLLAELQNLPDTTR